MSDEHALRAAQAAYYQAFADRDAAAMAEAWAAADDLSCVHPGWPPIFGRVAIIASYRDIFLNSGQLDVVRSRETFLIHGQEARVVCLEKVGGATLVATNCFRLIDARWRLVHHQASPLAMGTEAGTTQARATRH